MMLAIGWFDSPTRAIVNGRASPTVGVVFGASSVGVLERA